MKKLTFLLAFVLFANLSSMAQRFFQRVTHEPTCTQLYIRHSIFFSDGSSMMLSGLTDASMGISNGGCFSYVNASGNTLWMRASDSLSADGAIKLPGGDIVVMGYSRYLGTPGLTVSDGNFVLTRFTSAGSVVWTKAYGNQYDDYGKHIQLLPNGTIEVYGWSEEYDNGTMDNFRARISQSGTLLEMKFQYSSNSLYPEYYDYDPITGNTYCLSQGTVGSFYVTCIDSTFNIAWENHYTTNFSVIRSIRAVSNGTILVAGRTGTNSSNINDGFILNISSTGLTLWCQKYYFGGESCLSDVDMSPSGLIIATGYSDAYSAYTYQSSYRNRMITLCTSSQGVPLSSTVYGNNITATGSGAFVKNDSTFYFAGEHGLLRLTDSYLILRVDSTLTNPVFCYDTASVTTANWTFTSTPHNSNYSLQSDTVQEINTNAIYVTIPITNTLICPTSAHTYQVNGQVGRCVTATSDSCFVFVSNAGLLKLTKFDPEGNIIWSHRIGTSSPYTPSQGFDIEEAENGDLLIGHGSDNLSAGGHACLMRTDRNGIPIWCTDKSVGGNEVSHIKSVVETPNKEIVAIAGLQQGNFPVTARFAVIKYDSLGHSIWTKEYVNVQSQAGGLDADGNGTSACGNSSSNAYVIQTDTGGSVLWSREVANAGPNSRVMLNFVERCPNGDVLYAGTIISYSPTTYARPYLIRFDPAGNIVWQKMYQASTETSCGTLGLIQLNGDQYIVGALGSAGSTATYKSYTFRIDSNGNVIWAQCALQVAGLGIEYGPGDVGYDSSLAFPASIYDNSIHFRFDKYSANGIGPCGAVGAVVTAITPTTTTITNPGLSASNRTLTETYLSTTLLLDSIGRKYVCTEGDTSYYSSVITSEAEHPFISAIDLTQPHLFPVPVDDELNITGLQGVRNYIISIYSLSGQILEQNSYTTNDSGACQVLTAHLSPGVYLVRIAESAGTYISTAKIIVR
ncbi:MAG: T9SS type A sorting domain-containing protein [Bacteroidia bacterium]|nr:T9SS type A sorting domain-containing protein [Bacteroidia bacterium]